MRTGSRRRAAGGGKKGMLWSVVAVLFASSWASAGVWETIAVHGFIDGRAGVRTLDDPNERDTSLGELRLQLDGEWMGDVTTVRVRSDFLYDDIPENSDLHLNEGTGPIDLREANVLFSPLDITDVKLGRQILTWGVGDLLFINDLFPKDWQSFFNGRDVEYLKAPSDALFVSLYPGAVNIDVAYTPQFDPDRFISGDRLSYWNPMAGARTGREAAVDPVNADDWIDDDEIAVRASRNVGGYELAAYAYDGFWKTPRGMDPELQRATFPPLAAYGASARGPLGKGLVSLEAGYYDSKTDSARIDPLVPNDEFRALVGYERELAKNLSCGVQYYVESLQDYCDYRAGLAEGQAAAGRDRQVATVRVTRQLLDQTLTLSVFAYYSPTDEDGHVRPVVKHKLTDNWLVTAGANIFFGRENHTFFGQFEKNTNVYGGVRYSF